jgi:hypothetical protein
MALTTPDPFDGIEAKIDRAGEHIDALYSEIENWRKGDPYSVDSEPKGQSTHHRIYVRLRNAPDRRRWGLLLGDAVHNMRSALDHLIYAVAIRVSGQDPPPGFDRLQFVIIDSPLAWKAQAGMHLPTDYKVRAVVKSVQPFKVSGTSEAHRDPLWWVCTLDNTDKHRLIKPVFAFSWRHEAILRTVTGGRMTITAHVAPIEHEATLLTISGEAITEVEDDLKADVDVGIDLATTHPKLPPVPVRFALDQMFERTCNLCGQFRAQFLS